MDLDAGGDEARRRRRFSTLFLGFSPIYSVLPPIRHRLPTASFRNFSDLVILLGLGCNIVVNGCLPLCRGRLYTFWCLFLICNSHPFFHESYSRVSVLRQHLQKSTQPCMKLQRRLYHYTHHEMMNCYNLFGEYRSSSLKSPRSPKVGNSEACYSKSGIVWPLSLAEPTLDPYSEEPLMALVPYLVDRAPSTMILLLTSHQPLSIIILYRYSHMVGSVGALDMTKLNVIIFSWELPSERYSNGLASTSVPPNVLFDNSSCVFSKTDYASLYSSKIIAAKLDENKLFSWPDKSSCIRHGTVGVQKNCWNIETSLSALAEDSSLYYIHQGCLRNLSPVIQSLPRRPLDFFSKKTYQTSSCRGQERSTFHSSSFMERATPPLFLSRGSPIDLTVKDKSYQISSCRGQERSLPSFSSLEEKQFPPTLTSQIKRITVTTPPSSEELKVWFVSFLDRIVSGNIKFFFDVSSNYSKFVSLSTLYFGCFVFESIYLSTHRDLSDDVQNFVFG